MRRATSRATSRMRCGRQMGVVSANRRMDAPRLAHAPPTPPAQPRHVDGTPPSYQATAHVTCCAPAPPRALRMRGRMPGVFPRHVPVRPCCRSKQRVAGCLHGTVSQGGAPQWVSIKLVPLITTVRFRRCALLPAGRPRRRVTGPSWASSC